MSEVTEIFSIQQPNRSRIFNLILKEGIASRQTISRQLDLSLPTVNQYLELLFKAELIREDGLISSRSVGRKAKAISVNPTARIALGMDITGHHFSLVAVDLCGHVINSLSENYIFVEHEDTYRYIGERINRFIASNRWEPGQLLGLGISIPAIVHADGKTHGSAKTMLDNATNFFDRISGYISVPFCLYNDANAGGFSEIYTHRNIQRMVYLSLSHSIGSAIIEDNHIVEGNNCRCGEFGHMIIVPNGVPCHCGQRGCANGYCSPDVLSQYTGGDLELFFRKISAGDQTCKQALATYVEYLSILIHNIRMVMDCDIIIGGGMERYINYYINTLCERVRSLDSFDQSPVNYIRQAFYAYEASAVGSALFFVSRFIDSI